MAQVSPPLVTCEAVVTEACPCWLHSRSIPGSMEASRREEVRARALAAAPGYRPWLHVGAESLIGLGLCAAGAWLARGAGAWHLAFGAALLLLGNAAEWRLHRDVLHARRRWLEVLYDRHTPVHHAIYVTGDMAMRSARELQLVLIPAYGIALIFLFTLPVTLALWLWGGRPLAGVFVLCTMGYVLAYEWLHLTWHLPASSTVSRMRLVRWLRSHHELHHHPRLMQEKNFNVTVPLWDWVRGTLVREAPSVEGRSPAR